MRYFFLAITILACHVIFAQSSFIRGEITTPSNDGAFLVFSIKNTELKYQTDFDGKFKIGPFATDTNLVIQFKGNEFYDAFEKDVNSSDTSLVKITIQPVVNLREDVDLSDKIDREKNSDKVSNVSIEMTKMKQMAMTTPDISNYIKSLSAVVANSELSNEFSVRGGNYDENLIYVNDFPIYKPFLTKSGQSEGLSFVNIDLTKSVNFYAGGWEPRFGDKLSSVLDIDYKSPTENGGSVNLGLLTNSAHLERSFEKGYLLFGARYKNTRYLLNTLSTNGEYLPRFVDFQGLYHRSLSAKTEMEILGGAAFNDYLVIPSTRTTNFGTSTEIVQLIMAFNGQEKLTYGTYQGGIKFDHKHNDRLRSKFILSGVHSNEREHQDIEGGYRLCDAAVDLDENNRREECITERGVGSIFRHSRNELIVDVVDAQYRSFYTSSDTSMFQHQWGAEFALESMTDVLDEYSFEDSSQYVTNLKNVESELDLTAIRATSYYQAKFYVTDSLTITGGTRFGYWSPSSSFYLSPRVSMSQTDTNKRGQKVMNKVALGVYHQPPFYRELRNLEGEINLDIKPQVSYQMILGRDRFFDLWSRPFKMTFEVYGKYLNNVIPYEVDDIKIRYYSHNDARAYVVGADFRFAGELIHGEESWINVGLLSTQEDILNDDYGFIRRPTDQRLTVSAFIQDHLPNNPLMKVNLNLMFGSGLPFAPLNKYYVRDLTNAPPYRRVDLGFSKLIVMKDREVKKNSLIETIWISLDILNLLGVNNTISYLWIEDYNGSQYAVPNTLSQRFVNLKVQVNF